MTYPLQNFNGEVWVLISNIITHLSGHVIIHAVIKVTILCNAGFTQKLHSMVNVKPLNFFAMHH